MLHKMPTYVKRVANFVESVTGKKPSISYEISNQNRWVIIWPVAELRSEMTTERHNLWQDAARKAGADQSSFYLNSFEDVGDCHMFCAYILNR